MEDSEKSQASNPPSQTHPKKDEQKKKTRNIIIIAVIAVLGIGVILAMFFKNQAIQYVNEITGKYEKYYKSNVKVNISGTIYISGTIPADSEVNILQREKGQGNFQVAVGNQAAKAEFPWKWTDATEDKNYDIKAQLLDKNKTLISESTIKVVTAPEANVNLSLSSKATTPTTSASENVIIGGKVVINGPVGAQSTVLVLGKLPGGAKWLEIERIAAKTNTTFSWNKATSGQRYELVATLQENEESVATSNVLTAVAPRSDVVLTINSNLRLDPPSAAPSISCGNPDSSNNYNAVITVPTIESAQAYYVEVGSSANSNDVAKEVAGGSGSVAKVNVFVENGKTYYARYAYTYCADCDVYDLQNWSGFSPTQSFTCSE